jgi:hypothetical protein
MGQTWWLIPIIPTTWEVEIKRIAARGKSRQKVSKTPSQQISWAWQYTPVIPAMWEVQIGG